MRKRCTHNGARYAPRPGKGSLGECVQCVKARTQRQREAGKTAIYGARYDLLNRAEESKYVSPARKARIKAMLEELSQ